MSLGMEDGRIHDAAISASTSVNGNHAAKLGPLNLVASSGKAGAWCAKSRDNKQWLQIDLGTPTTVTRVATQGRQGSSQWVTSYSLSYSLTGSYWVRYTVRGKKKVMTIAQFRYIKIQSSTKGIVSRLKGINPYKSLY